MTAWLKEYAAALEIAAGVALLLIVLAWWHHNNAAHEAIGVQKCQNLNDLQTIESLTQALKRSENQRAQLENETQILRALRSDLPTPVVRLCRYPRPASHALPGAERSTPARAGTLSQEGGADHPAGRDIGTELFALLDEADDMLAACRAEGH